MPTFKVSFFNIEWTGPVINGNELFLLPKTVMFEHIEASKATVAIKMAFSRLHSQPETKNYGVISCVEIVKDEQTGHSFILDSSEKLHLID